MRLFLRHMRGCSLEEKAATQPLRRALYPLHYRSASQWSVYGLRSQHAQLHLSSLEPLARLCSVCGIPANAQGRDQTTTTSSVLCWGRCPLPTYPNEDRPSSCRVAKACLQGHENRPRCSAPHTPSRAKPSSSERPVVSVTQKVCHAMYRRDHILSLQRLLHFVQHPQGLLEVDMEIGDLPHFRRG